MNKHMRFEDSLDEADGNASWGAAGEPQNKPKMLTMSEGQDGDRVIGRNDDDPSEDMWLLVA